MKPKQMRAEKNVSNQETDHLDPPGSNLGEIRNGNLSNINQSFKIKLTPLSVGPLWPH